MSLGSRSDSLSFESGEGHEFPYMWINYREGFGLQASGLRFRRPVELYVAMLACHE